MWIVIPFLKKEMQIFVKYVRMAQYYKIEKDV